MIKLIINADDFGQSKIFNEQILDLLEKGFVRSTTVMVNRVTTEQNAQIKRLIQLQHSGRISVGLHVELDAKRNLKSQILEQFDRFNSIFGFPPSHLDLHVSKTQNPATPEDVKRMRRAVMEFAEEHDLPARNMGMNARVKRTTHQAFMCINLSLDEIIEFIKGLKDNESAELITHPGKYDPDSKSSLNADREKDYENVVKLQKFLNENKNIKNISYLDL
jgi:predicted glycoside hydrolase/deacetylase ChbG (UPF0249 family)